jgi:hypothetical protein
MDVSGIRRESDNGKKNSEDRTIEKLTEGICCKG